MIQKAFLIVDLQNDFMPGGALGIKGADEIVSGINSLALQFPLVVAVLDWHPPNHISFEKTHPGRKVGDVVEIAGGKQILWPVHCVQDSYGAKLSNRLDTRNIHHYIYKGVDPNIDSYSAFFDNQKKRKTGLHDFLIKKGVRELYIAGLATEYCVKYSACDALELGYTVFVIVDVCRPVNLHLDDEKKAILEMKAKGIHVIQSSDV